MTIPLKPNTPTKSIDPFRPKFHFSTENNWLNDPNGMVYYRGEYHLFYQYHPEDIIWGPMHWGHAVSRDLVKWEYLPVALHPDELGMIFSGSAVIDHQNTAGFGPEAMVAIFTHHNPESLRQTQSLAYSLDCGRTWTKYPHNPVLEPTTDMPDFRDPKVFWFKNETGGGHWVMCLAVGTAVHFYTSFNLIDWEMSGRFGGGYGSIAGVWETPEFFKLPVKNGSHAYWVMSVGVLEGGPGGGSGTQYFVGNFDGQKFVAHYEKEMVLWVDHGSDFYAVQSWNDVPDGRRLWLAWMNNWQYGKLIPTSNWRGLMTIPREVGLVDTQQGPRLIQSPARELQSLRGREWHFENILVEEERPFSPGVCGDGLEIMADVEVPEGMEAENFGLRIRMKDEKYTTVGYWTTRKMLYTDRFRSGEVDFHEEFGRINGAVMEPEDGRIRIHLLIDRCSIELFGNNGLVCFSELIFPGDDCLGIELYSQGGPVVVRELVVYELGGNS
jgi:fructan beta-fructosidase